MGTIDITLIGILIEDLPQRNKDTKKERTALWLRVFVVSPRWDRRFTTKEQRHKGGKDGFVPSCLRAEALVKTHRGLTTKEQRHKGGKDGFVTSCLRGEPREDT